MLLLISRLRSFLSERHEYTGRKASIGPPGKAVIYTS